MNAKSGHLLGCLSTESYGDIILLWERTLAFTFPHPFRCEIQIWYLDLLLLFHFKHNISSSGVSLFFCTSLWTTTHTPQAVQHPGHHDPSISCGHLAHSWPVSSPQTTLSLQQLLLIVLQNRAAHPPLHFHGCLACQALEQNTACCGSVPGEGSRHFYPLRLGIRAAKGNATRSSPGWNHAWLAWRRDRASSAPVVDGSPPWLVVPPQLVPGNGPACTPLAPQEKDPKSSPVESEVLKAGAGGAWVVCSSDWHTHSIRTRGHSLGLKQDKGSPQQVVSPSWAVCMLPSLLRKSSQSEAHS